MRTPAVSIAIPTYNRPQFLAECLKSIFAQTYRDFHVHIFDNCSTFDLNALLNAFPRHKITVVRSSKNIGGLNNLARIFEHRFRSAYLMVFHDDDTLHPAALAHMVKALRTDPQLSWAGSTMRFIHDHTRMSSFKIMKGGRRKNYDAGELVRALLRDTDLCFGSILYRVPLEQDCRTLIRSFSKWFDRPFLIEAMQGKKAALFTEPLVNYRIHTGQDSIAQEPRVSFKHIVRLMRYYQAHLPAPVSRKDQALFLRWSTNNAIQSCAHFARDFRDYRALLKDVHRAGLFKLRYITLRGLYYCLKVPFLLERKKER